MARKVRAMLTLQLEAGKASPAPPVGPALGQHGVNIMDFVKAYNERTASQAGEILPAQITIFEDRTFTFVIRTPPASDPHSPRRRPRERQHRAAPGDRGQHQRGRRAPDRGAEDAGSERQRYRRSRLRSIAGTARSMGIEVEG